MPSQTLIFVPLPNGLGANNTLKLSLYLTPRLDGGATLSEFPDFLNWPQSILEHGLQFQIACGAAKAAVSADTATATTPLRPDIWQAIFAPDTYVEPYQFPNFDSQLIVSYPVRDALTFLKYAYQSMGTNRGNQDDAERGGVFEGMFFRQGGKWLMNEAMSEMRLTMWKAQQAAMTGAAGAGSSAAPVAALPVATAPDGIPTTLQSPSLPATKDMITRFALFHHLAPAPNRPPLPVPDAGFAKTMDFHQALTALSSYPSLLRALGLVFDVEVPVSLCPISPAAGAYGSIAVSKVTPGFKWQIKPQMSLMATSYWRAQSGFCAAPATAPAEQAAGSYVPGDVFNGFLALSPQNFLLSQVDLDGALLKAMGLADNVQNLMDVDNLSAYDQTLPSLRSSGLSLMADGRGLQLLQSILNNKSFNQSLASSKGAAPRAFNAQDLVRGYRIDIWSSRTGRWHSLHARTATYGFGPQGTIKKVVQEEGFTQLAAAQPAEDSTRKPDAVATKNNIPQPGTDVHVHERVSGWNGWSLSVARPGKALNRSADPTLATNPDPTMGDPVTPFKMTASFVAAAGSLPELRFGTKYRLRARTVDLAGNSLPYNAPAANAFVAPAGGRLMPYLRFEPVSPPLVLLQQTPQSGGSLERLVIRSLNSDPSLDSVPTPESDPRHIAPPRVAVRMVEQHGMLDTNGRLDGSQSTYTMATGRDSYKLPQNAEKVPMEPNPTLNVGYLPDPIARGAALRNLPNAPDNTNGRIVNTSLSYAILPDVDVRPGSVTYIDFGAQPWPNAAAFRLVLVEGGNAPKWDAAARVLTVSLSKASTASVPLSSYLAPTDLEIMGVWDWLRQCFEAAELSSVQNPSADAALVPTSDEIAQITRLTLEGGHPMITPSRTLTLIHAVQQPLGVPAFLQLPVIHQPSAPIYASALRNSFTPITAWRSPGSHQAVLLGGLSINGGSTAQIDLQSCWLEVSDDPSLPAPTETVATQQVEKIDLSNLGGGPIYSDATNTRMVAVYIPQVDVLWFSGPMDILEGVSNPSASAPAAPVHGFDDTRHRWVAYTAVATSRFKEYFPQTGLDFTRSSQALVVDVPSSARPAIPDVNYVVPTFGWEQQQTSNVKSIVRKGGGLRVYLNRGWYSSGQDELLGVILWAAASPQPSDAAREQYKGLFSQWGVDPIWANGALAITPLPTVNDFPNATATATSLTLAETDLLFDVAGHQVAYDAGRKLWYCDIEVANLFTYSPFIRLALARYQSHSIQGVELSPVVLADFAQLTPDRSALLSIDPADPRRGRLYIGGLAPLGPLASVLQVSVETRNQNIASDLDWKPVPAGAVTITEDAPPPVQDNAVLWSGTIVFAKNPGRGQNRLVIREYETLTADAASGSLTAPPVHAQRLVYAAILPYDYP